MKHSGIPAAAMLLLRRASSTSAAWTGSDAVPAQSCRLLGCCFPPAWVVPAPRSLTPQPAPVDGAATCSDDGGVHTHGHASQRPWHSHTAAALPASCRGAEPERNSFALSGSHQRQVQPSMPGMSASTSFDAQHSQCATDLRGFSLCTQRSHPTHVAAYHVPHKHFLTQSSQHSRNALCGGVSCGTSYNASAQFWRSMSTGHTGQETAVQAAAGTSATATASAATAAQAAAAQWNWPNALSIGRGLSGPVIAYWVLHDQWGIAIPALIISGATDWLDGYLARRLNQGSVLGSYLDPLGDKVLMGCVIAALAYKAMIPVWVAFVVVGRDVGLVGGMFVHRFRMLGWRWPGFTEFFSTDDDRGGGTAQQQQQSQEGRARQDAMGDAQSSTVRSEAAPGVVATPASGLRDGEADHDTAGGTARLAGGTSDLAGAAAAAGGTGAAAAPAAGGLGFGGGVPMMQPLMISKVNTVLQLGLVGGCMTQALWGWPGVAVMHPLELTTAATTVASTAAYLQLYLTGKLLSKTGK